MTKRHVITLTEHERRAVREALMLVVLLRHSTPLGRRALRVVDKFGRRNQR